MSIYSSSWKLMLGIAVIFAAGIATGSALTARAIRNSYQERMNPDTWEARSMAWLGEELELTPAQSIRIKPFVATFVSQLKELRTQSDDGRRRATLELYDRLEAELSALQRERLEKIRKQKRP